MCVFQGLFDGVLGFMPKLFKCDIKDKQIRVNSMQSDTIFPALALHSLLMGRISYSIDRIKHKVI